MCSVRFESQNIFPERRLLLSRDFAQPIQRSHPAITEMGTAIKPRKTTTARTREKIRKDFVFSVVAQPNVCVMLQKP
jgi:hypothetical protein